MYDMVTELKFDFGGFRLVERLSSLCFRTLASNLLIHFPSLRSPWIAPTRTIYFFHTGMQIMELLVFLETSNFLFMFLVFCFWLPE